MLDRLLILRRVNGESGKPLRSGGIFSLFERGSYASKLVRAFLAFGVGSGVDSLFDLLDVVEDGTTNDDERLPSTEELVWERVSLFVGISEDILEIERR